MINEDNDNNVQRPRPEFLNHFDQKDKEKVLEKSTETGNSINNQAFGSFQLNKPKSPEYGNAQAMQQQFQQVPGAGKIFLGYASRHCPETPLRLPEFCPISKW